MKIKLATNYVTWPENSPPLVDIYELLELLYNYDYTVYTGVLDAMTKYDDDQFDVLDTLQGHAAPNEFGKIVKAAKNNICGTQEAA